MRNQIHRVGAVKAWCAAVLMCVVVGELFSADPDATLAKIRSEKPKEVVKCAPAAGPEGVLGPLEAFSKLKKGALLKLAAGKYPDVVVDADGVFIEGEPEAMCAVNIRVRGKNCVVRRLWARSIRAEQDLTIVDSAVMELDAAIEQTTTTKLKLTAVNSAFGCIRLSCDNGALLTAELRGCTVSSLNDGGNDCYQAGVYMAPNVDATFSNCVLYSKGLLLGFGSCDAESKEQKLSLRDCVLYGESLIGFRPQNKENLNAQKRVEQKARDIASLKKMCKGQMTGKIELRKPDFHSYELKDVTISAAGDGTSDETMLRSENFMLKTPLPFSAGIKSEAMGIQGVGKVKTTEQVAQAVAEKEQAAADAKSQAADAQPEEKKKERRSALDDLEPAEK